MKLSITKYAEDYRFNNKSSALTYALSDLFSKPLRINILNIFPR